MNESQVEAIRGNQPHFSQLSPDQPRGPGGDNRTLNESMIEPLNENRPMFKSITPNGGGQQDHQRSLNEAMLEPIRNNPLFSQMSPPDAVKRGKDSINESMMEPIQGNNPRFS